MHMKLLDVVRQAGNTAVATAYESNDQEEREMERMAPLLTKQQ